MRRAIRVRTRVQSSTDASLSLFQQHKYLSNCFTYASVSANEVAKITNELSVYLPAAADG